MRLRTLTLFVTVAFTSAQAFAAAPDLLESSAEAAQAVAAPDPLVNPSIGLLPGEAPENAWLAASASSAIAGAALVGLSFLAYRGQAADKPWRPLPTTGGDHLAQGLATGGDAAVALSVLLALVARDRAFEL